MDPVTESTKKNSNASISSVNSDRGKSSNINNPNNLINDDIIRKLNNIHNNTNIMIGGFMNKNKQKINSGLKELLTEVTPNITSNDKTDDNTTDANESAEDESISDLSPASTTSYNIIQSGGSKNNKIVNDGQKQRLTRGKTKTGKSKTGKNKKTKVKVEVSDQNTYSLDNGNYMLSDSNIFTITD
jgi:hypothetical protein